MKTIEQKEKHNAYQRLWRFNNKQKVSDINKKHRESNKKRILEFESSRKEYKNAWRREDYKNNKSKYVEYKLRHNKSGRVFKRDVQFLYEENIKKHGTLTCYLCLSPIQFGDDTIDHKIPVSRGGSSEKENLDIAHKSCNFKKHTKTVEEYLEATR